MTPPEVIDSSGVPRRCHRLFNPAPPVALLSTVTVAELLFGALRSRDSEQGLVICRQFCSSFQLLALDYASAERSGVLRADLEERGERIGAYDMLIAGIALARNCILVTHNVREFGRVAGLRIEDWTAQA